MTARFAIIWTLDVGGRPSEVGLSTACVHASVQLQRVVC